MQAGGAQSFRAPWKLFWVAFLVRVLYMTLAHTYRFRVSEDHFQFGWELGRIARSLATGHGYANPFNGNTGPTAWIPPLYTLLVAGAFKLFGVYTRLAAWAILCCNSIFSAATALAVYEIAARCYNRKVAMWSGWLWVLYPAAMQYAVRWIWDMSLTAMLFAFVLVLALRMRGIGEHGADADKAQTTVRWATFGLLWGLIALTNPSPMLFLPVCGIWVLMGARRKLRALQKAVLAAVVFCACMAPWVWRNWVVFHAFVPTRSNFGAELYEGNGPGSNGFPWGPTISLVEQNPRYELYAREGELAYVQQRDEMAKAYIRAHPERFLAFSAKRFFMFWAGVPHPTDSSLLVEAGRELNFGFTTLAALMGLGLSLKKRIPAAGLFAWAFLLLPLVYYFVTVQARFRHPLEPLMTIFAVYLFQSAEKRST
jgi:4-amino-4-deoxy-L-arabinose transferase-like glycosyltransferase